MSVKPILFNTDMVRAILDGRKTVTRRVLAEKVMLDKKWGLDREPYLHNGKWYYDEQIAVDDSRTIELKPKYQPGDILYVRETWCDRWLPDGFLTGNDRYGYKADGIPSYGYWGNDKQAKSEVWIPSIHMPKEAARIWLKVTAVRVERLQDITNKGAISEGAETEEYEEFREWATNVAPSGSTIESVRDNFSHIWDSTIKKEDIKIYSWNAHPWVWVIEFERCEKPKKGEE